MQVREIELIEESGEVIEAKPKIVRTIEGEELTKAVKLLRR